MLLLYMTVLAMGAAVFTATLYTAGFGTVRNEASARLARLKGDEPTGAGAVILRLRRRATVSLGGLNLLSGERVQRWQQDLERAGLSLNAREYMAIRCGVGLLATLLAFVVVPIPVVAVFLAPLGYAAVGFWLKNRIGRRRAKIEGQLPELLQTIASGLRAGFGFMQALEAAAEQMPPPISVEVRRMIRDVAVGASVEEGLQAMNRRVASSDLDIVVTAILIQRAVGGNLAEILDSVAHTMRERERIRGEIRTLTAQQRLAGYVLGAIPIGLVGIFFLISPDYISLLFTDRWGLPMVSGAVVMEVLGFIAINKIVSIEV